MEEIGLGVWDERIHTKNKSKYEIRKTDYHTGHTVRLCNTMKHDIVDINYDFYLKEVNKLIEMEET
jgi:hypothetical protein